MILALLVYESSSIIGFMINHTKHAESTYKIHYNKKAMEQVINMQEFNDTFNMYFVFNNAPDGLDVLDNEYFKIEAYNYINKKVETGKTLKLRKC